MDENSKPNTPFEKFVARRIAEFPTLYSCADDVIVQCILDSSGECYWKNGILLQGDQHYDSKTGNWTKYPLRISIKAAFELRYRNKTPRPSWNIGNAQAPISHLPNNADQSFLDGIDLFLFVWSKLTKKQWRVLAEAYTIQQWQVSSNPYAGEPNRTLGDMLRFAKLIPKWRKKIREIELARK